jgi:hypothetical protein
VFLYPVGSTGQVVHSGASEPRNVDAVFFMLGWDRYRYDKKCVRHVMLNLCFFASSGICGSCSALLCIREAKCRHTNFHARVRPIRIWQKARKDALRQSCVFFLSVGFMGHVVHSSASGT